jgi:cytidyltransferase-like protein
MFIAEMFEPRSYVNEDSTRVVVTYPGRFQPFHLGHADVFQQLQNKFGRDNVFIVTSNDTSSAKSPFNFNDKVQLMTAAGVPAGRILESNKPYDPPEQFGYNIIFITALGAPDAERLAPDSTLKRDKKDKAGNIIKPAGSPSYFKTFKELADCDTADNHGYVVIIPEARKTIKLGNKQVDVSHGTEARAVWNQIRGDESLRAEYLTQMFSRDDVELGRVLDKIPNTMNEDAGGVGVIASRSQARDPRYSMSLTKDVRPGETDRQLRKMHLKDSRILNHPTPTVETIAEKHNVTVDYVTQQLEQGMQVESEHTKIKAAAREIALDHLNERPDYYVKLKKVER